MECEKWKFIEIFQVTWPCPYMVKKSKIFRNQEADDLETWYTASGNWLPIISNNNPGLTLTIFMPGSDLFPNASGWVIAYKALCVHVFPSLFWFSISSALRWAIQDQSSSGLDTIVVYDIKVGWWSQLHEYMKLYGYPPSLISLLLSYWRRFDRPSLHKDRSEKTVDWVDAGWSESLRGCKWAAARQNQQNHVRPAKT